MGTAEARVLVVDDERAAARATAELLRRAGYVTDVALGGGEALALAAQRAPDLMLLDFEMPDMDGGEVLQRLRGDSEDVPFPVLILTGRRVAPGDQVLGLERGAADYIVKGVDRGVLLARVRAALRRNRSPSEIRRGRLRVDLTASRAWLGERRLILERKPLGVLHHLALREGQAASRSELLRAVWETEFKGFYHSVDQAVYAVRKELHDPRWIETIHGYGYRFVVPE